jgi:F-type H+-transporting ATPase subunit gamma
MSGSLLEVKKKIKGVQSTRKITKAMQLVAASKMRQFQTRAVSARDYVTDLSSILRKNISDEDRSIYTEKRKEGKVLFVLYTSDKGLCGALNTKLINTLFRSERWKSLKDDEKLLITIGKKANGYAMSNKMDVASHFTGIPEKLTILDAIEVVDGILEFWKNGEAKEIIFIVPHYKNSFTTYPVIKTFLPFSKEAIDKNLKIGKEDKEIEEMLENDEDNMFMIFNPGQEAVVESLYLQTIQAMFIQSFLELKASEYSSRMIAMQNATDAADRMIGDLKLVYNKARQQAITQEIAELVGASMALADQN